MSAQGRFQVTISSTYMRLHRLRYPGTSTHTRLHRQLSPINARKVHSICRRVLIAGMPPTVFGAGTRHQPAPGVTQDTELHLGWYEVALTRTWGGIRNPNGPESFALALTHHSWGGIRNPIWPKSFALALTHHTWSGIGNPNWPESFALALTHTLGGMRGL